LSFFFFFFLGSPFFLVGNLLFKCHSIVGVA